MNLRFDSVHILTAILICISMMIAVFSTDSPVIIGGVFIFCLAIILISGNKDKVIKGLILFLPYSIITTGINFFFVNEGRIVLFNALGRNFTLESLIYALVFSSKLLSVIYIFMLIDLFVDSDRAVSYFSSVMPKSTLTLMIAFKLFPSMKKRLFSIREVYAVRGVDFEKNSIKQKIVSYIPILSILLETSMAGAFDIGEAAYCRGFLSGRRSVYDKQLFKLEDYIMIINLLVFLALFISIKFMGLDAMNIYSGIHLENFINWPVTSIFAVIIELLILLLFTNNTKRIAKEI